MMKPRKRTSATATAAHLPSPVRSVERFVASLMLLAISLTILSYTTGHEEFEGAAKNGVRRAASQLEKKTCKGCMTPPPVKSALV